MNEGHASATARLIALATVMREHDAPAGAAPWCARMLSTRRSDRLLLRTVRVPLGRWGWGIVQRVALPGMVAHWLRRKREIDRLARQAAADDFTQLLVLGSGLDTLAWRMADDGVFDRVLAADHPATLAALERALPPPRPAALLAADLSDGLPPAVADALDPAEPTLVVVEGVLMYLRPDAAERLLGDLAALPVPRVRLIASFMVDRPGRPIGFANQNALVGPWLARRGEPMRWASTPDRLGAMLSGCGMASWRVIEFDRGGSADGPCGLPDERLVVAER